MYSCNTPRQDVVVGKTTQWQGFKSVHQCRFDQRYTELHQSLGCKGCTREWDWSYLRQQGLLGDSK